MAKGAPDNAGALAAIIIFIFVAGGYLAAWLTIQKIHFLQTMFWVSLWIFVILLIGTIVCFISFLLKDDSNYYNEFWDKNTLGWTSLLGLILIMLAFGSTVHLYNKGYSNEAIKTLIEAEGKMQEFNYIRDALTGVLVERVTTEALESAMQDICSKTNTNLDCNKLMQSYSSVKNVIEAKERADDIMGIIGLANKQEGLLK